MSSSAIKAALYSKLSGDTTLMGSVAGIYDAPAPQGAAYPYVTFQEIGNVNSYTLTLRVEELYTYQIMVHGRYNRIAPARSTLDAAKERIDALLSLATLTVTGEDFWYCRNTGNVPDASAEDSDYLFLTVGARYEIALGG